MTTIAGYCVRWVDEALIDGHRERFQPGAFQYAISTNLRVAHDPRPGAVLAWRVPVMEDEHGLYFEAELDPENREHRRVVEAVRAGQGGVSFGYRASRSRWDDGDCEVVVSARLLEISVLSDASYPA